MADDQQHTLELIARHLIVAAQPLVDAAGSVGAFMRLLWRLGFEVSDIPAPYQALANTVADAVHALENLPDPPPLDDLWQLLARAKAIYDGIQHLATAPVPNGADPAVYAAEIGERLFELLLTDYLAVEQPAANSILSMLNVIATEHIAATPTRPSYVRTHFRWEELPKIVSDPAGLPARVYGWGEADFNVELLLRHLSALAVVLGAPVAFRAARPDVMRGYLGTPSTTPAPVGRALVLPFWYANIGGTTIEAALAVQRLAPQGAALPGLILEPRLPSEVPLDIALGPSTHLNIRAGTNVGELFGITLRPPGDVALRYPLAPGTPPPAAGVGAAFTFQPDTPVILLGDPAASRVELASATVSLGADITGASVDLSFGADLKGLKVVIAAGEGDGFLSSVIGDKPAAVDIPLGIDWSRQNGIRFKGSAAFEVSLYPHLQLGPLSVDVATISLTAPSGGPPRITLKVTAGISGALGPVKFVVQDIGLAADVVFQPGNAGPFGIDLGFKPPDGIGLAIEAGDGDRRRLPRPRSGAIALRRESNAVAQRHDYAYRLRPDRDANAGWQPRLFVDHLHHRRGFRANPSWARLHAARHRRHGRRQPDVRPGCAARRDAERHAEIVAVPAGSGG
jgi:hypothetical protein